MTNWLSFAFSFAIVLALLGAVLFLMKKMQSGNLLGIAQRRIRLLETFSTGPRQKLILVRVRDQEILIGLTAQQMTTLANFTVPEEQMNLPLTSNEEVSTIPPLAKRFADMLKSAKQGGQDKSGS
jgi:flagellar biosynthetic protein FliO